MLRIYYKVFCWDIPLVYRWNRRISGFIGQFWLVEWSRELAIATTWKAALVCLCPIYLPSKVVEGKWV